MTHKIWNKKKIVKELKIVAKSINRTPTERYFRGTKNYRLYKAAKRYFGNYTNALQAANLKPNLQFWYKEKIISEFQQITLKIGHVPTFRDLVRLKRYDILNAIRMHYDNQYNKVVTDSGFEPNNIRWNENNVKRGILFLANILGHTPTERELKFHACDLLGGATRVFGSLNEAVKYVGLKPNQSFVSDNLWKFWEKFTIKVAKKIYGDGVSIHLKFPNNTIPDIVIDNKKIIEAKLNISSEKIAQDIAKYKKYIPRMEFWYLYGIPPISSTQVKFVGPKEIEKILKENGENVLLSDLFLLKKGINPQSVKKLNDFQVNGNV